MDRLLPLVYEELRALAAKRLGAAARQSLGPTEIVHEAYLRLVDQTRVDWQGRTHFFAVGATAVRRALIDAVRRRRAAKRGGPMQRVTLEGVMAVAEEPSVDLVALDDALEKLSTLHERQAKVVELRFFGGLNVKETADVLGVSPRTVDGDWRVARAWLRSEMSRDTR